MMAVKCLAVLGVLAAILQPMCQADPMVAYPEGCIVVDLGTNEVVTLPRKWLKTFWELLEETNGGGGPCAPPEEAIDQRRTEETPEELHDGNVALALTADDTNTPRSPSVRLLQISSSLSEESEEGSLTRSLTDDVNTDPDSYSKLRDDDLVPDFYEYVSGTNSKLPDSSYPEEPDEETLSPSLTKHINHIAPRPSVRLQDDEINTNFSGDVIGNGSTFPDSSSEEAAKNSSLLKFGDYYVIRDVSKGNYSLKAQNSMYGIPCEKEKNELQTSIGLPVCLQHQLTPFPRPQHTRPISPYNSSPSVIIPLPPSLSSSSRLPSKFSPSPTNPPTPPTPPPAPKCNPTHPPPTEPPTPPTPPPTSKCNPTHPPPTEPPTPPTPPPAPKCNRTQPPPTEPPTPPTLPPTPKYNRTHPPPTKQPTPPTHPTAPKCNHTHPAPTEPPTPPTLQPAPEYNRTQSPPTKPHSPPPPCVPPPTFHPPPATPSPSLSPLSQLVCYCFAPQGPVSCPWNHQPPHVEDEWTK